MFNCWRSLQLVRPFPLTKLLFRALVLRWSYSGSMKRSSNRNRAEICPVCAFSLSWCSTVEGLCRLWDHSLWRNCCSRHWFIIDRQGLWKDLPIEIELKSAQYELFRCLFGLFFRFECSGEHDRIKPKNGCMFSSFWSCSFDLDFSPRHMLFGQIEAMQR